MAVTVMEDASIVRSRAFIVMFVVAETGLMMISTYPFVVQLPTSMKGSKRM